MKHLSLLTGLDLGLAASTGDPLQKKSYAHSHIYLHYIVFKTCLLQ